MDKDSKLFKIIAVVVVLGFVLSVTPTARMAMFVYQLYFGAAPPIHFEDADGTKQDAYIGPKSKLAEWMVLPASISIDQLGYFAPAVGKDEVGVVDFRYHGQPAEFAENYSAELRKRGFTVENRIGAEIKLVDVVCSLVAINTKEKHTIKATLFSSGNGQISFVAKLFDEPGNAR